MKLFNNKSLTARKAIIAELPALLLRLWRFGYSLSGNADIADDLVQDTCVRALSKAEQFKIGTRLDSWTFTICRSIWLNDIRSRKVRLGQGVLPVEEIDLPDTAPSVEMNIFTTQVVEHVLGLPDAQRQTVFLVYVEGFTYREASKILDIPVGTVMSRLATARAALAPLNETQKRKGSK